MGVMGVLLNIYNYHIKMTRIKSSNIELYYDNSHNITREQISNVLSKLVDDYIVCLKGPGEYHCLTYTAKRHDLTTCKKFEVGVIVPRGYAVKKKDTPDILNKMVESDREYISKGLTIPLPIRGDGEEGRIISPMELENIYLRERVKTLESKISKMKKQKITNITYNTINNFGNIFNVIINDLGKEDITSLTLDEKKIIMDQKMDKDSALMCIEKIHLNSNIKNNNNIFKTNCKSDRIIVRRNGKWDVETNPQKTYSSIISSVPKYIRMIGEDPQIPKTDLYTKRLKRFNDYGVDISDSEYIRDRLPDLIHSYTKSITDMSENDQDK